jgi:drug/metabolite transporter (DMT)-like permease
MDPFVFGAVLLAAACHAGWNVLMKMGLDPFANIVLINTACGIAVLPLIPFVGHLPVEAWPWLAASIVLHLCYYLGLTEAYRAGDIGQVYPIARGSAPLLTAVASTLLLGENVAPLAWAGVLVLVAGVFLLSLRGGRDLAAFNRRAVGFALFTALTISGYSIVDGTGARVAGNPHAYSAYLFSCDAVFFALFAAWWRGPGIFKQIRPYWKQGAAAGVLSAGSYWTAIWAMTVAPIAIVAALRETSVLFAAIFAVIFLKEPLRASRIAAAIMIVTGLALIRLA